MYVYWFLDYSSQFLKQGYYRCINTAFRANNYKAISRIKMGITCQMSYCVFSKLNQQLKNSKIQILNQSLFIKKMSTDAPVEEIYQKLSQLEHILLRPDTYSTKFFFIYQ